MSLSDKRSIYQVLGCLLKDPSLLGDVNKYQLNKEDFPEPFHRAIFGAIWNLYKLGSKDIDHIAVDNYLSSYAKSYEIFLKNDGIEWCQNAIDQSSLANFDYYYTRVKKFSLLRECERNGISVIDIYNEKEVDPNLQAVMQDKFDKYDISDIIKIIDTKVLGIKEKFVAEYGAYGQQAGKGAKKLKEELKKQPEMGVPLCSSILNAIIRGVRLKKLYMRSAPTGVGKCIVGNTLINTEKGLIRIEDIPKHFSVNDNNECQVNIISYDVEIGEKNILPTSHWYNMGHSKTIKIKSSMGYEIEGTPEHPIVVGDSQGNTYFKKLQDITKEDKIILSVNNELFGTNSMTNDMAYLLGFLTGDGCLNVEHNIKKRSNLSYSKNKKEVYSKVNELLQNNLIGVTHIYTYAHKNNKSLNHSFGNQQTIDFLEHECDLTMNTASHKKVPSTILTGTKEVVKSFLQGLFDTDGSITGTIFEYSTASERLSKEVQILLLNFGIISKRRSKWVKGKEYYIISIHNQPMLKLFNKEIGFNLAIEKSNKLIELINKAEVMNSNNDFVYGKERLELLHAFLKENDADYKYNRKKSLSYKINDLNFYESMKNGRNISRERIKQIMSVIPNTNVTEIEYLRNVSNNMFFDTIEEISEDENIVYDFTVPETHCFVANGTISHNTRLSVGDACNIAIDEFYDVDTKQWVKRNPGQPTLFITTELEVEEVQTMCLAFISGVAEEKILDGKYTTEEEARVDYAIEVLERCPLWIEHMPNFDVNDIEYTIKKYIILEGVRYVFFDYIHTSMKLLEEIANQSKGMRLREDNVLLMFVDRLKGICNQMGVHIFTSTQVNGEWKSVKDADQNILRGAKAMADKLDVGIIALEPTKADLDALKPILDKGFYKEPNMVYHIYKNRRGKIVRVKLWLHVDLSTCRTYDLFVTDKDYKVIPVQSVKIILDDPDSLREKVKQAISSTTKSALA